MVKQSENSLIGIKQIVSYTGRPWKVINIWVVNYGFPAKKLYGRWMSRKDLYDDWEKRILTRGIILDDI